MIFIRPHLLYEEQHWILQVMFLFCNHFLWHIYLENGINETNTSVDLNYTNVLLPYYS